VVSDSGKNPRDSGWLSTTERWTVSSLQASYNLVVNRMGYAWLPYHIIQASLQQQDLKVIPLLQGSCYHVTLYNYYSQHHSPGPATEILATIFTNISSQYRPSIVDYL
jgi:DNA-binding transcriptional LysR family regulator